MTAPLVLLHGFGGGPASFGDVLAAMAERSRCATLPPVVVETLIGHGARDAAPDDLGAITSFDGEVDRIAARLRTRGVTGGAHLCGYSLGARIALGLLVRHSELFERATLIGPNPGLSDEEERIARARDDDRWAERIEREGLAAFADAWEAQPLFETQARLPAAVRAAERARRLDHRPEGLARAMRILSLGRMPDYRLRMVHVHLPVRLLVGGEDTKFRTIAAALQPTLPRADIQIVPGAGHNLLLEAPEAVAEALLAPASDAGAERNVP